MDLYFLDDLALAPTGDLSTDDALQTAVHLSLFSNRRYETPPDNLPPQGYWADQVSELDGDQFGSLLWLLAREKCTPETLARLRGYCLEALQWLIDDGIADTVDVQASYLDTSRGRAQLVISIYRPGQPARQYRYLWDQIQNALLTA